MVQWTRLEVFGSFWGPCPGKADPPRGNKGVDCGSNSQNQAGRREALHWERRLRSRFWLGLRVFMYFWECWHWHFRQGKLVSMPAPHPLNASSALRSLWQLKMPLSCPPHQYSFPKAASCREPVGFGEKCSVYQTLAIRLGKETAKAWQDSSKERNVALSRLLNWEYGGRSDSRSHSSLLGSKVTA